MVEDTKPEDGGAVKPNFKNSHYMKKVSIGLRSAAHISPQQIDVGVADTATECGHRRALAVEHRGAEARGIVLGKLAQVEDDEAGTDHVAAVAGLAIVLVDLAALVDLLGRWCGFGERLDREAQRTKEGNAQPIV
jgi:hypothetical protein